MERIAVITGGSSGIGRETARLLSSHGYRVYELSRSGKDTAGIRHITTDLTDSSALKAAFRQIGEAAGKIDLLINNAGFGISGATEFTSLEDARRLFDVNFFGMLACIQNALPLLRNSSCARIVNISSVAAVFAIPFQSFYSASKASVNMLTLALRNELKPFQISVCCLMPGDVKTGFTASRKKQEDGQALYGAAIQRAVSAMERDEANGMAPEAIAKAVFRITQKRSVKPIYTAGAQYRLFVFLGKLLPYRLANWIVGKMYL